MYHINGWTCMDTFEKELEAGVTVMPEVETVFYQYIDRGVDITEFSTYIERKYPNIKDLWLSQNFFSHYDSKSKLLLDFYNKFKFRSLVIESEQGGMPLEDFVDVVPPPKGLIAFRDGDRCPYDQLPGYNSDCFYGWLKKGSNFNPESPWYKLCYMYALEPTMVFRSDAFIGYGTEYSIALPEPDLSLDLLMNPTGPLYQYMSNNSRAQYILANPKRLFFNKLPNTETLIEVLNEIPALSNQMDLDDIPLVLDRDNTKLLMYLIRKGRIDGKDYYRFLLSCGGCKLSDIPEELRATFAPPPPPPPPPISKPDSGHFAEYIYLSRDEKEKFSTLLANSKEIQIHCMIVSQGVQDPTIN